MRNLIHHQLMVMKTLLASKAVSPPLRYVSLFSGIEAGSAAFERLALEAVPVRFSEIDPVARAVLRHRWPDIPQTGDVNDYDWSSLRGMVDLVFGGPPCQAYSAAGLRHGSGDPRGRLVFDFIRAVGAMQPGWFLLENVPGLLTANKGHDFSRILDAVEELGYGCAWHILDASQFGLPQRRRRLWIFGERLGDGGGPESVLGLSARTSGPALESGTAWQAAAHRAPSRFGTSIAGRGRQRRGRTHCMEDLIIGNPSLAGVGHNGAPADVLAVNLRNGSIGRVCHTLMTKGNSLNSNPCLLQDRDGRWALRRLAPRECLRLQGFDADWLDGVVLNGKPLSDMARYRLIGNS